MIKKKFWTTISFIVILGLIWGCDGNPSPSSPIHLPTSVLESGKLAAEANLFLGTGETQTYILEVNEDIQALTFGFFKGHHRDEWEFKVYDPKGNIVLTKPGGCFAVWYSTLELAEKAHEDAYESISHNEVVPGDWKIEVGAKNVKYSQAFWITVTMTKGPDQKKEELAIYPIETFGYRYDPDEPIGKFQPLHWGGLVTIIGPPADEEVESKQPLDFEVRFLRDYPGTFLTPSVTFLVEENVGSIESIEGFILNPSTHEVTQKSETKGKIIKDTIGKILGAVPYVGILWKLGWLCLDYISDIEPPQYVEDGLYIGGRAEGRINPAFKGTATVTFHSPGTQWMGIQTIVTPQWEVAPAEIQRGVKVEIGNEESPIRFPYEVKATESSFRGQLEEILKNVPESCVSLGVWTKVMTPEQCQWVYKEDLVIPFWFAAKSRPEYELVCEFGFLESVGIFIGEYDQEATRIELKNQRFNQQQDYQGTEIWARPQISEKIGPEVSDVILYPAELVALMPRKTLEVSAGSFEENEEFGKKCIDVIQGRANSIVGNWMLDKLLSEIGETMPFYLDFEWKGYWEQRYGDLGQVAAGQFVCLGPAPRELKRTVIYAYEDEEAAAEYAREEEAPWFWREKGKTVEWYQDGRFIILSWTENY